MKIRNLATIMVALFAVFFGAQFAYLAHGDVINNYPFISPDGFDWYTEGMYLTQLFSGTTLPELPVLRPPLFVFVTAADFILGSKGLILAAAFGVATFCTYYFSLKIVDSVNERNKEKSWYVIPLAISTTIYPLNYFKPFILADSLAVALSLASVLLLISYSKKQDKYFLVASCAVAILAGLTQTYALIPFLIFSSISALLSFRSNRRQALQFIGGILVASLIFVLLTLVWRGLMQHGTTPKNFDLLRFSTDMSAFYLSTWSYYFLPLILFFLLFRSYRVAISTTNIVILSSATMVMLLSILAYFYQWPDARFTFYIWPWLMILFLSSTRLTSDKGSYWIAILFLSVVVLVPSNYWEPSWKSMRVSLTQNWVGDFFRAAPVDRKFNACKVSDCAGNNEFLNRSDAYVNSTIKLYNQLKLNRIFDPSIAKKYEGKIVHRTWVNGSKDDGWFFVERGERRWISDSKWMDKNGFDENKNIEISAQELNAIPENPKALNP